MSPPTHLPRTVLCALLAACAGGAFAAAPAAALAPSSGDDDAFLMIDRELRAVPVNVSVVRPDGARVTEGTGVERTVPLADIVALVPAWWRAGAEEDVLPWLYPQAGANRRPSPAPGVLVLTDGQRILGRLGADTAGETIAWDHARLGRFTFPLDDVRRIQIAPPLDAAEAQVSAPKSASDRVVMTNADVVSGFIESITSVVRIESDGRTIELPLKQVGVIELANPPKPPAGMLVWLQDGSVVGARGVSPDAGPYEVRLALATTPEPRAESNVHISLPLAEVVAFVPDAARVRPMAALPIATQTGVGDRRYTDPIVLRWRGEPLGADWSDRLTAAGSVPPLSAPDIELPGPMRVEWTLPPGASRVAGWAEIPVDSRLWADFTLTFEGVSRDGEATVLASEPMNAARPVVEFNVQITGMPERLRISIEPGARGPIQDRAVLRRTLLLLEPR